MNKRGGKLVGGSAWFEPKACDCEADDVHTHHFFLTITKTVSAISLLRFLKHHKTAKHKDDYNSPAGSS